MGFQKSLRSCSLDESRLYSIGSVKTNPPHNRHNPIHCPAASLQTRPCLGWQHLLLFEDTVTINEEGEGGGGVDVDAEVMADMHYS